jgi:hypothetical protein
MRRRVTSDGQMKGKLSYMSPEQLNSREVDRRTDVFAAGVVAWECLTGKRLFAGSDPGEVLAKVLTLDIAAPIEVQSSIPRALSDTVMRALERSPEQRWQTARDLRSNWSAARRSPPRMWWGIGWSSTPATRCKTAVTAWRAWNAPRSISDIFPFRPRRAQPTPSLLTRWPPVCWPSALRQLCRRQPCRTAVEAQPASGPRDASLAPDGLMLANAGSGTSRSSNLTVSSSAAAKTSGARARRPCCSVCRACAAALVGVAVWHWHDGGFDEPDALPSPAASLPEPPSDVRTVPTREPSPAADPARHPAT